MRRAVGCLLLCLASVLPAPLRGGDAPASVRVTTDGGFKQHLQWPPDGKRVQLTRIDKAQMGKILNDSPPRSPSTTSRPGRRTASASHSRRAGTATSRSAP